MSVDLLNSRPSVFLTSELCLFSSWVDDLDRAKLGELLGWIMTGIYFSSRLPQVRASSLRALYEAKLWRKQSTQCVNAMGNGQELPARVLQRCRLALFRHPLTPAPSEGHGDLPVGERGGGRSPQPTLKAEVEAFNSSA